MPITHGHSTPADATMSGCIAATAGADIRTSATTQGFGTIRDFMDGAGILGERRLPGVSGHGVGAERRGGDSMAGGGIRILSMRLRTTGFRFTLLHGGFRQRT